MLEISTEKDRLDLTIIHDFLTNAYWATGRTMEEVQKTIEHCLCYGVYVNDRQVGFARVLTDYAVFAYVMDVFILPEYRGKGYSKELVKTMLSNDALKTCKWMLKTADAHGLYEQFGFEIAPKPDWVMERNCVI